MTSENHSLPFEPTRLSPTETRDLFLGSARVATSALRLELHAARVDLAETKLALESEKQQHRQTAHALYLERARVERAALGGAHLELCQGYERLTRELDLKYGIELAHSAVDDVTGEVRRLPGTWVAGESDVKTVAVGVSMEPVLPEPPPAPKRRSRAGTRKP